MPQSAPSPLSTSKPQWGDDILRIDERRGATRRASTPFERPTPPESCGEHEPETFVPDPLFAEWIRETFLAASGLLANEEHQHLLDARIGVLWTNAINVSKQRTVLATAEVPQIQAGGWKRARFELQLRRWFIGPLDFLLTFSAPECEQLSDRAFCALVEHELYHCAHAEDKWGSPKFNNLGEPVFAIRDHDISQFVGVMARYGPTSSDERAFIAAANRSPSATDESIEIACGVCVERRAA